MDLDQVQITVINWNKYQTRKDVNHPTWFRLDHSLFDEPDMIDFTQSELLSWVYILCLASKKNSDRVTINKVHLERIGRVSTKSFEAALEKLQRNKQVHVDVTPTLRARDVDVPRACPTDRQTDITDRHAHSVRFAFDEIYKKYPLKKGKGKGLARCRSQIKTEADLAALSRAVDRYAANCLAEKTEPKFIKHFSTFMNEWQDWLDPETGSSTAADSGRIKSFEELTDD